MRNSVAAGSGPLQLDDDMPVTALLEGTLSEDSASSDHVPANSLTRRQLATVSKAVLQGSKAALEGSTVCLADRFYKDFHEPEAGVTYFCWDHKACASQSNHAHKQCYSFCLLLPGAGIFQKHTQNAKTRIPPKVEQIESIMCP